MRIPRLFIDQPLVAGTTIIANKETAHYVATVLRIEAGRDAILFNGEGGEFTARIATASKKSVEFDVLELVEINRESSLISELAIGISRGDRMDLIVQKATELGVSRITPLFTERCEVKLKGERAEKKLQHWQQIIVNACEQSQRTRLPILNPLTQFDTYLADCQSRCKLIMHPIVESNIQTTEKPESVSLLVGPEGGFSETELELAVGRGFKGWVLGPRILRTETAPIAGLAVLQHLWGDF